MQLYSVCNVYWQCELSVVSLNHCSMLGMRMSQVVFSEEQWLLFCVSAGWYVQDKCCTFAVNNGELICYTCTPLCLVCSIMAMLPRDCAIGCIPACQDNFHNDEKNTFMKTTWSPTPSIPIFNIPILGTHILVPATIQEYVHHYHLLHVLYFASCWASTLCAVSVFQFIKHWMLWRAREHQATGSY